MDIICIYIYYICIYIYVYVYIYYPNIVCIFHMVLFSACKKVLLFHIMQLYLVVLGDHHVKKNKPDSKRQIPCAFSHMQNLDLKKMNDMNIKQGL
jgi:hypothetical protein